MNIAHSHGSTTRPLWLIQPRLDAGEYRDRLIGSVVKYPNIPTERHIPHRCVKLPRDMVSDLDPKPMQIRNVKFWQRRIKDASVSASFNDLLEAFGERAREENSEKVATIARMWHMDQPGEKFKELLKNKAYFEELFELLRSNHDQGYFITDIVTLVNLEVLDETGKSAGGGARAMLPLDSVGGLLGNVGGGAKVHVQREKGFSASYVDETIVFLGYRLVRLEKVVGTRAKLGRIFLGQKHGFTIRDGFEYWPTMKEIPVEGNAEPFMGAATPAAEGEPEDEQLVKDETDDIAKELGFDVEIVG